MKKIIGILGAMTEEIQGVTALLIGCREIRIGKRTYFTGEIGGIQTVVVFSRWGKVAAATTVSTLIHVFKITELIFTGVAGAIHPDVSIGDIVIAKRVLHHDLDARPMIKQYEIPLLDRIYLETDPHRLEIASVAIDELLDNNNLHAVVGEKYLIRFNISAPVLHIGDVASGDQFFSASSQKQALNAQLPGVLCVEMEGAAVAQVCFEHDIPFTIIRTISDDADEHSPINFAGFIRNIASIYSVAIVENIYARLRNA